MELSSRSEDFREGMAAFREKRPARSKGADENRERLAVGGRRRDPARRARRRGAGLDRRVRPGRLARGGAPAARGRSGRCVRGPTTKPGTRCSAAPGWSRRPGRSSTAAWTCRRRRPDWSRRAAALQPRAAQPARAPQLPRPPCSPTAPRSSGCASCRRSCAPRRSGASCSASPAPAPTWRRCRPGPQLDGDEWVVTGQKVWTTWGFAADFAVLLARTDPDVPKRNGTHLLPDRHAPAGCRRPAAAPHHRRGRLLRGLPRRRPGPRCAAGRRGQRRAGGWPARRCPASGRWSPAQAPAGSTGSAAAASPA